MAFIAQYRGDLAHIARDDGSTSTFAVIGRLDDTALLRKLSDFVAQIAAFKSTEPSWSETAQRAFRRLLSGPEFAGKRKSYVVRQRVTSENTHGYVVTALQDQLKERWQAFRTALIDLYVFDGGRMTHLFEVKTDVDRGSLYQAVGQLMLHGAFEGKRVKRILTVPNGAPADTEDRLRTLGISVLQYSWRGRTPVFHNLQQVMKS